MPAYALRHLLAAARSEAPTWPARGSGGPLMKCVNCEHDAHHDSCPVVVGKETFLDWRKAPPEDTVIENKCGCVLTVSVTDTVATLLEKLKSGVGPVIIVWEFGSAPKVLQELSRNGGDEDWIALVPPELKGTCITWLDGGHFGNDDPEVVKLPHGYEIRIASHA